LHKLGNRSNADCVVWHVAINGLRCCGTAHVRQENKNNRHRVESGRVGFCRFWSAAVGRRESLSVSSRCFWGDVGCSDAVCSSSSSSRFSSANYYNKVSWSITWRRSLTRSDAQSRRIQTIIDTII